MTNPPNIDAIIAELSEATGPSRELFEDVWRVLFPMPEGIWVTDNTSNWTPEYAAWQERQHRFYDLIEVEAFFDAAMTLAEPNWWLQCSAPLSPAAYGYSREEDRKPRAGFQMIGPPYSSGAQAATLPLAICIAALRVRSALIGEVGRDG